MLMLFGCASVVGVVVAVIAVQCLIWSGLVAQFAFQTKYVALVDGVIERIVIFGDGCLN